MKYLFLLLLLSSCGRCIIQSGTCNKATQQDIDAFIGSAFRATVDVKYICENYRIQEQGYCTIVWEQ